MKILVSACLAGINCRYDGKNKVNKKIKKMVEEGKAVCVCPEELGELSNPRPASEILNSTGEDVLKGKAKVINKRGEDVTSNFIKGAYKTLDIAKKYKINKAILKSKSAACGKESIYDGSFKNRLIKGNGVTCALLLKNNMKVLTEAEWENKKAP